MALTRAKKESLFAELSEIVKNATSLVFVHVAKTPVPAVEGLRRKLRSEKAGLKVAKKTIMARALDAAGISGNAPTLQGEIALAYGSDILTPARELAIFRKGKEENVVIFGGVIDGAYVDTAKIMELASIPPLQTLRGMFVNIINSPIQRFAIVLNEVAKSKTV